MSSGFIIKNLKLHNFRNYDEYFGEFHEGTNKIIGPNATGKTNIIEAISLLTQIHSFRNSKINDLINKNAQEKLGFAQAEIFDKNTKTNNTIRLNIKDGKKTYIFNDKKKSISALKGNFPSVVFTPDHLNIVKGSNTVRRSEIDSLGAQISADYYKVSKDYAKVLSQKNSLLKEKPSKELIKSLNDVMTIVGAQLVYYRLALVNKLRPIIQDYYSEIADNKENLNIKYFPSWAMDDAISEISRDDARLKLTENFSVKLNDEIQSRRCTIGPHRDRVVFFLNDSDAQSFASQGQQRSIVLAFKLSEVRLIEDVLDKRPILLLDDVMSELDQNRQKKLLNFIEDKSQVFITSTI